MIEGLPALAARGLILVYRLSFSAFAGRWCRYLPTCSQYADEAIARHGLWAGGWMAFARVCRCGPGGASGYDPPPKTSPAGAKPFAPWRYGDWRGPRAAPPVCEAVPSQERAMTSTAKP